MTKTISEKLYKAQGLGIRLYVMQSGALAVKMWDPEVGEAEGTFSIQSWEFGDDARADYDRQIAYADAQEARFAAEDAGKVVA